MFCNSKIKYAYKLLTNKYKSEKKYSNEKSDDHFMIHRIVIPHLYCIMNNSEFFKCPVGVLYIQYLDNNIKVVMLCILFKKALFSGTRPCTVTLNTSGLEKHGRGY